MKIIQKLNEFQRKVNAPQRVIVAIIVPLVILAAAYVVIDTIAEENYYDYGRGGRNDSPLTAFNITGWMWAIVLFLIGVFEFFWFRDK